MLKFGVFFFLSFPLGNHSGNTVPPRAHLVALLAEIFISQTEGQISHKKKQRERTTLANEAIHTTVAKWHDKASFYVPYSLQFFSFILRIPTGGNTRDIENNRECLLLNKRPNTQSCIDMSVCVCLLFPFRVRNWVILSLVNLLTILSRNSGI